MEITLDKIDKTEALIKVILKEDDYQPGVSQKIKEYTKKASIKGFRPGKVPTTLIQKMYGKSILVDEINNLLSKSLSEYLRESDLQFLGEPIPKDDSFDESSFDNPKDFTFEYNVGFAEEFSLPIDAKMKIDKYAIKIDDKVVNETIENLQRQFGELSNPEVSEEKDVLHGQIKDASGEIDKEIAIDLNETDKAITKKLIGLKINDQLEIDPKKLYVDSHKLHHQLDISHDAFDKLKGKLTFILKGINRTTPAEINQELFDKTFGPDTIKSLGEFKVKIKETVGVNFKNEEEQYFDYQLRELLTEKAKINLPDNFLKNWLLKTNEEITPDLLEKEYKSYAQELKWSLIRNKIVKDQEFKIEHPEVIEEAKVLIRKQFGSAGLIGQMEDKLEMFAENYLQGENGDNYMKVYNQVQQNKVLKFIKEQITIKEKDISLDDFRKL